MHRSSRRPRGVDGCALGGRSCMNRWRDVPAASRRLAAYASANERFEVNELKQEEQLKPLARMKSLLGLAVCIATALGATSRCASRGQPQSLFNGRDLSGWHVDVPARDT